MIRILFLCLLLAGCSALTPMTAVMTVGEAVDKIDKAENPDPSEITDVVKDKIDPNDIEQIPLPSPNFDTQKALTSIPWWMYAIVIVSGIITLINSVRLYLYRRRQNDTSGTDNDGRRSSDGRSVQVHGPSAEEQAETDGNDDGRSATESGSSEREPRVRISFGRRSSGSSWKR
mgnify:CR=1 FL=1